MDKKKPEDLTELENFTKSLTAGVQRADDSDELRIRTNGALPGAGEKGEDDWNPECVQRVREAAKQHRFLSGWVTTVA